MNQNILTPKKAGFNMPAEWYPHSRCWMAWPCHELTWQKIGLQRARLAIADVANAISEFEPVTMLVNPDDKPSAQELCSDVIDLLAIPLNDSWTRDTGPMFLLNSNGDLGGVDWIFNAWGENHQEYDLDNQIAKSILELSKAHYFHAPFVLEGGSLHGDGEGTILTTKECLLNKNRNPNLSQKEIESSLCEYLSCEKIIWLNKGLEGDTTNGHVDELACFIAPGKVLALMSSDPDDANYNSLQENLAILQGATDAKGRPLEVYLVEQPPATYLQDERLPLSYINFYRANEGIILPKFGYQVHDNAALERFQTLFPEYKIKQMDALDVFAGGGGFHCITLQQPRVFQG